MSFLYYLTDKGSIYVTIHCVSANAPKSTYFMDGVEVVGEQLEKLKQCLPSSGSKKQAEVGLMKPVVYRDFKLDSINWVKVNGEEIFA